jgi:hypothetical protein
VNFSKGGGRPKNVDVPVVTESDFENYIDMFDDDDYWDEIIDDSIDYEGVANADIDAVHDSNSKSEKR